MRKTLIWACMFLLLGAYTWQLTMRYGQEGIAHAYAASPQEIIHEKQSTVFARIIERLSLRQEKDQERCDATPGWKGQIYCRAANIFAQVIFILSSHVS